MAMQEESWQRESTRFFIGSDESCIHLRSLLATAAFQALRDSTDFGREGQINTVELLVDSEIRRIAGVAISMSVQ